MATSEGVLAGKQLEEDDSQRPHIHVLSAVPSLLDDLGRHVRRSAAVGGQLLIFVVCEAEVDELDVSLVVDEHVRHLEVTVVHAFAVQVLDCSEQLDEEEESLLLRKLLRVLGTAELAERGGATHLHDEEDLREVGLLSFCLR